MRGEGYCDKCGKRVKLTCPEGHELPIFGITVDLIIEMEGGVVLVKRPEGLWALPGGYVEFDETLEEAAIREAMEELGARSVELISQFHTYGDPKRDTRRRNVTVVYLARVDRIAHTAEAESEGIQKIRVFPFDSLPELAFDHSEIIEDYIAWKKRILPLAERRRQDSK